MVFIHFLNHTVVQQPENTSKEQDRGREEWLKNNDIKEEYRGETLILDFQTKQVGCGKLQKGIFTMNQLKTEYEDIHVQQHFSRWNPDVNSSVETYRNRCASLCRSVVEFSLRWRSCDRMKASSYAGRSILYISCESAPSWAAASSCSMTEAVRLIICDTRSLQWCLSLLLLVLCHFPGLYFLFLLRGKERIRYHSTTN